MIDGKPVVYGHDVNTPINGCNLYRFRQPLYKIIEKDLITCSMGILLDFVEKDVQTWIDKCDVLFTQLGKSEKLLSYIKFCRDNKINKKFILDSDDNMFYVSPYNPSYYWHGIEEVDFTMPDGTIKQIRDGKDGFCIEDNKKFLTIFGLCCKAVDCITTPSPVLSGFYKKFNKNVKVIKNFLDLSIWKPVYKVKHDDFVRILWQGGWSHYEDWWEISDVLKIIMSKYKNVKLIIFGTAFEGTIKDLPQDRIERESWVDILSYPYKLRTIDFDIGICPLKNNLFNTCKSELKWEEYSALEVPTVASNIPPYSLNIEDGYTGLLCTDTVDWVNNLSTLIESKELRIKLGKEARKRIEEDYDLEKGVNQYFDLFNSFYRKELVVV